MKQKLNPKGSVIAALDVGTTKISAFVARIVDDEGNFDVVGVGHQASAALRARTMALRRHTSARMRTSHSEPNAAM